MNIDELNSLSIGDHIVHRKYGVGCYAGLKKLIGIDFTEVGYHRANSLKTHLFNLFFPVMSENLFDFCEDKRQDSIQSYTLVTEEDYCSHSPTNRESVNLIEQEQKEQKLLFDSKISEILKIKEIHHYSDFKWLTFENIYNNKKTIKKFLFVNYTFSFHFYIPADLLKNINNGNIVEKNIFPRHITIDEIIYNKKPNKINIINIPAKTEKRTLATIRIVQGKFREELIEYWKGKCAVTGFKEVSLLKASHIKPWRDCDCNERCDRFNGLLLAPGLDSAFDKGYITFSDIDGSMLISDKLSKNNKELLGIITEYQKLSKIDEKHKIYLRYHLSYIYENWNKE